MNRKMTTGAPELHPIPVKSLWYHIGIDFVGPISPARVMMAVDIFSQCQTTLQSG